MNITLLTVPCVRRILTGIEKDYPDAHTEALTGYDRQAFMAGVMRTGYPPKKPHTLITPDGRFLAEANACVLFLAENNLIETATQKAPRAALDANDWRLIIGAYNRANNFKDDVRPHDIEFLAFIVAARHVGLLAYASKATARKHHNYTDSVPVYAISRRAYVAAGLNWHSSDRPRLLSRGQL